MKRPAALACVALLGAACDKSGGSAATSSSASASASAAPVLTLEERAAKLHRESIVVDTHDDVTSTILEDGFDLGKPDGKTATDLPKMRAGGIGAEFFSIYVDPRFYLHPSAHDGGPARRALDMIDVTYQQIERHPQDLVFAGTVDDVRRAKRDGKIAILMGIEGGYAIEDSLSALRDFYRLGVRYMTLTHSVNGDWADSSGVSGTPPEPKHHGLSPFGEDVVREMQRIGMLVDVSHVSDETVDDVLRVAKAPVIASHSSARALCDASRNLSDDQLRAIAKNGGVVMVNFFAAYIDPKYRDAARAVYRAHADELAAAEKDGHTAKMNDLYGKLSEGIPRPPLSVLVDHIEHVAKVAGVDHVGLGSDFDGVSAMPVGLEGMDGLPKITLELLRRGWSDEDVKKVLGENFLRVMAAAEAYAHATGGTLSGDGSMRAFE
ncbi:MAG TPA: dipeptidase [Polyangiaceae bacterium]|nr:dipeptidase [Polyangiaceae bacterium]